MAFEIGARNAFRNSIRNLPFEELLLIFLNCGGRCWICQRPFSPTDDNRRVKRGWMQYCHGLDKQFGGGAVVENAVIMCPNCHSDETVRVPCGRAFSRGQNVVCRVRVAGPMGRASAGDQGVEGQFQDQLRWRRHQRRLHDRHARRLCGCVPWSGGERVRRAGRHSVRLQ